MAYIGNPIYQSAFVTDQFSGDGTTTAFTMSVSPAGVSNVLVAVSGVLQDPSTYGVVGTTINFSTAPPSGTGNISCRYLGVPVTGVTTTAYRTVTEFTATASQTTFTPPSYTVGFINVYRNGVLLGSADYTASNGTTVVLATGATVGDLVTVESFQISSVANAIQNTAGSVSGTNIATGAVTPAKLSTGGPYWDTSSNLGVGTTSPARNLTLTSSGNTTLQVTNNTSGTASADGFIAQQNGLNTFLLNQEAGALHLGTSNIERISIDSSGRVTTPYQPVFQAFRTSSTSSGNYIIFNATWVNVGSHYNTSNGRFTAPVTGVYEFSYSCIGNSSSDVYRLGFHVNGSSYTSGGVNSSEVRCPSGISYPTGSATIYVSLNAGDYAQIYFLADGGNSLYGDSTGYVRFAGRLMN